LRSLSGPAGLLTAAACAGLPAVTAPIPVVVEVRARTIRPGEPVRLDIRVGHPVATLSAEILGRAVHLVRVGTEPTGGETWSGWSAIPLDRGPGPVSVEVAGVAVAGAPIALTHAFTVEPRSFPEERLDVAPEYVAPPPQVAERLERERRLLSEVYATRRDAPLPREPFARPVPGAATSVFGTRRLFNGEPRAPHPGLDLRAASGTAVQAAGPGRIALARDLYYSGKTVILDHGGGLFTVYAHLSEIAVGEGGEVRKGETIGRSGATGRVTGPHLHWGAKIGDVPVDPAALLDDRLF
jgi:hypothetical protein